MSASAGETKLGAVSGIEFGLTCPVDCPDNRVIIILDESSLIALP